MKAKQKTGIFRMYLKQNIGLILLFAVSISIFTGVFYLYRLDNEAVYYAASLCLILYTVFFLISYIVYYNKHKTRTRLFENICYEYDNLPLPGTLAEADYQYMIECLGDMCRKQKDEYDRERKDSVDYYSTWVHQIKTPISAMKMMLESDDTEENRELLLQLFSIEQYVDMALCYIRLDSESSDYVFKEYELDDIIRQAIRKFAPFFIRRKISVVFEPVSRRIVTDEKWLQFVIEQLLSNAIKYTKQGSVTITVSDNQIAITDTGIGISKEDIPRIFEKGYTGYNGRADKKATGLGLYLCRQIADKLNMEITAESELGKGSTFYLQLPADKGVFE